MRRNMQEVLERWGRWAASEEHCSLVDWPSMSVTAYSASPGVLRKPRCTDEDGLTIDTCVAHMGSVCQREELLILGQRFIGGHSTRLIAENMNLPRLEVRKTLQASEAFLEGCLVMLNIKLDMDLEVILPTPLAGAQKPVLVF